MDNLQRLAEIFSRLEQRDLSIQAGSCTRLRSPKSGCRRCEEACPHGVIDWISGLKVDPVLCDDCGRCAAACPNGVFRLTSKDPFDRLAQLGAESDANGLRIGCERLSDPGAADLVLTCYGAIDASFMALAATTDSGGVKLLESGCSKCDRSGGADLAQEISDVFMIPVIEPPPPDPGIKAKSPAPISGLFRAKRTDKVDEDSDPMSRRQFFGRFRQTVSTKMDHPAHNRAPGNGDNAPGNRALDRPVRLDRDDLLRQRVPEKRQRLIDSMARASPGESAVLPMTGLLWTVAIDAGRCDLCSQCSMLCPSGALRRTAEDSSSSVAKIEFAPAFCTGCQLCADLCPKGALSLAPQKYFGAQQFSTHELQTVVSFPLGWCGNCGKPFVNSGYVDKRGGENRRCEACELRGKADEVLMDLM